MQRATQANCFMAIYRLRVLVSARERKLTVVVYVGIFLFPVLFSYGGCSYGPYGVLQMLRCLRSLFSATKQRATELKYETHVAGQLSIQ